VKRVPNVSRRAGQIGLAHVPTWDQRRLLSPKRGHVEIIRELHGDEEPK
jgi:hypothetical protein